MPSVASARRATGRSRLPSNPRARVASQRHPRPPPLRSREPPFLRWHLQEATAGSSGGPRSPCDPAGRIPDRKPFCASLATNCRVGCSRSRLVFCRLVQEPADIELELVLPHSLELSPVLGKRWSHRRGVVVERSSKLDFSGPRAVKAAEALGRAVRIDSTPIDGTTILRQGRGGACR